MTIKVEFLLFELRGGNSYVPVIKSKLFQLLKSKVSSYDTRTFLVNQTT